VRVPASLALAAVAVASAFYLLPSSIAIVSWTADGPSRIAVLAPLSRLWLALAVSAVVFTALGLSIRHSGGRDRLGRASLRLSLALVWVVPFLPWLPDRAPFLLILAGPLRWAVLAFAAGGAGAAMLSDVTWAALKGCATRWSGARAFRAAAFAVSLVVYLGLGLRFHAAAGFSGDEPHYLVIAHSLLVDRDLDIANNHERRDYRAFFGGELRPDYLQRGQGGEIYSIHAPGLPAILLPAYAVAGPTGAVVVMGVLAALAALAIFDLAVLAGGAAAGAVTWAAMCLTVPFIPHAWLIYPEAIGAFVVAWSALWIWRGGDGTRRLLVHGALLALLPWVHTKFVVLTVLLAAWQCARLLPRIKALAVFLAPIALSIGAWLFFFYRLYGTFDPQAPYGASAALNAVRNIPHGVLGLVFDQKFGVLAYSPVYLLGAIGFVLMVREARLRGFAIGSSVVFAGFLFATTRFYMWWGGSSAPARFLLPVLPLLAPAIALAVTRLNGVAGRAAVAASFVVGIGVAAICMASPRGELLFSDPHGTSRLLQTLQGSAPLDTSLATFTEEDWHAPLGVLALWLMGFGAAAGLTLSAVRVGLARTPFAAAATMMLVFGLAASGLVFGNGADQEAIVNRGRLSLIRAFDPSRFRAVDVSARRRLPEAELADRLALTLSALPERGDVLPEGEYEARTPQGTAMRFALPVPAPVSFILADTALAHAAVTIRSARFAAGAERSGAEISSIERLGNSPTRYLAYVGDTSYPEGGVFWTRGTDTARLLLVPAGAAQLLLTLHIGPSGGGVALDVDARHVDLEMTPNETRDVTVPLSLDAGRVRLAIRAARSFTPAAVDKASDDQRALGVQVRPRLLP
jgi:hypothetical protein